MNQYNSLFGGNLWILLPIILWALFWKGCALWISSKNNQKGWFLALLVLNTVGILEIFYVFKIAKKKWSDIKEIFTVNKPVNQ